LGEVVDYTVRSSSFSASLSNGGVWGDVEFKAGILKPPPEFPEQALERPRLFNR
jgi:hypothetical protein